MRPEKTERNRELVAAYKAGLTMKQIGDGFGLHFSTVRGVLRMYERKSGELIIRHPGPPVRTGTKSDEPGYQRQRLREYYQRNKWALKLARVLGVGVREARKVLNADL